MARNQLESLRHEKRLYRTVHLFIRGARGHQDAARTARNEHETMGQRHPRTRTILSKDIRAAEYRDKLQSVYENELD